MTALKKPMRTAADIKRWVMNSEWSEESGGPSRALAERIARALNLLEVFEEALNSSPRQLRRDAMSDDWLISGYSMNQMRRIVEGKP
jgi:hypothetical protein